MAIWDALKKGATAAKCASGWHAGNWHPVDGKPECNGRIRITSATVLSGQ